MVSDIFGAESLEEKTTRLKLEGNLGKLQEELKAMNNEKDRVKRRLQQTNKRVCVLESERNASKEQTSEDGFTNEVVKQSADEAAKRIKLLEQHLKENIDRAEEVESLRQQLVEVNRKAKTTEAELVMSQMVRQSTEAELKAMRTDNKKLVGSSSAADKRNADLQRNFDALKKKYDKLQSDAETSRQEKDKWLDQERAKWRSQQESVVLSAKQEAQSKLKNALKEKDDVRNKLASMQKTNSQLQAQLNGLKAHADKERGATAHADIPPPVDTPAQRVSSAGLNRNNQQLVSGVTAPSSSVNKTPPSDADGLALGSITQPGASTSAISNPTVHPASSRTSSPPVVTIHATPVLGPAGGPAVIPTIMPASHTNMTVNDVSMEDAPKVPQDMSVPSISVGQAAGPAGIGSLHASADIAMDDADYVIPSTAHPSSPKLLPQSGPHPTGSSDFQVAPYFPHTPTPSTSHQAVSPGFFSPNNAAGGSSSLITPTTATLGSSPLTVSQRGIGTQRRLGPPGAATRYCACPEGGVDNSGQHNPSCFALTEHIKAHGTPTAPSPAPASNSSQPNTPSGASGSPSAATPNAGQPSWLQRRPARTSDPFRPISRSAFKPRGLNVGSPVKRPSPLSTSSTPDVLADAAPKWQRPTQPDGQAAKCECPPGNSGTNNGKHWGFTCPFIGQEKRD